MKRTLSIVLLATMCSMGQTIKAQLPKLKDIPVTAKFGGYIIGNYTYYDEESKDRTAGFNLRLARVYVNGTVATDFKYRLQMEVNGAPDVDKGPRIVDAYV